MITNKEQNTNQNTPLVNTEQNTTTQETVTINPLEKNDKPVQVDVDVKEKQKSDRITLNFVKGNKVSEFIKTKSEAEVLNNQQGGTNPIINPQNPQSQLQQEIKTLDSIDAEVKKFHSHVSTQEEFLDMAEMLLLGFDWLVGAGLARASLDPSAKPSQYEADTVKINKLKPYVAKWLMNMKQKFPMWFFMALLFVAAYKPPVVKMIDKRKEIKGKRAVQKIQDEENEKKEKAQNNLRPETQQPERKVVIVQQPATQTEVERMKPQEREIFVPKPPVPVKSKSKINVRDVLKNIASNDNPEEREEKKANIPVRKNRGQVPVIPVRTRKKREE